MPQENKQEDPIVPQVETDKNQEKEKEISKLKMELEKAKAERDLFKKERDEANANILRNPPQAASETDFDKIFGGIV